jgi:glycosyltransferase involved in cell wall biosynthesis
VLTQAPLEPSNSLKDLIWALDLLCCIRRDVHLVILGTGSQRWRLERFARSTEVLPNLHFVDALELVNFRSVDFYWNSISQWESAGLLQALSCQVPVVSTYLPGCELLRHQQTAMLTELGSRDQFARWTKYLLEHPAAAEQMAAQARRWSLGCRPPGDWAAGYEGCYRQLISPRATGMISR